MARYIKALKINLPLDCPSFQKYNLSSRCPLLGFLNFSRLNIRNPFWEINRIVDFLKIIFEACSLSIWFLLHKGNILPWFKEVYPGDHFYLLVIFRRGAFCNLGGRSLSFQSHHLTRAEIRLAGSPFALFIKLPSAFYRHSIYSAQNSIER